MDTQTLVNLLLVLLFVLVGGVFAATEMAIVTLREGQVRALEAGGERGRRLADLVRNPNQFLSAVQIGVTVAGFFSSAYGGSTIAPDLVPGLVAIGIPEGAAATVALVAMTLLIAYLSLVLGELVPKRLAMQRNLAFTRVLGPPLGVFAMLVRPVIWLLSVSTNAVMRLVGGSTSAEEEEMTPEEIRDLIEGHQGLHPYPRRILTDVFRAGDRALARVLRPRTDIEFLAGDLSVEEAIAQVVHSSHSRFPVTGRDVDDVTGFVHIRDLMRADPASRATTQVSDLARPILALPDSLDVLPALARLRGDKQSLALVVDEYGGTAGMVTMEDLVEEVVGEIYDEYDTGTDPEDATRHRGEAVVVDGSLNVEELSELIGTDLSGEDVDTAGGLVMARLGRVARVGDVVEVAGHHLEVIGVDGRRVARLRMTPAED
ncbi:MULTISPECIES: hemolysin family protein [Janibacter]|uniref:Putative hemolysin n=1 Tax=Janibacter indicus TaxID=857417 RepID=A0A1W2BW87_9MICO|nr:MULTISPECIES: hemolysin family protein [Janibacter]QNF92887.1 HlyC/CorC family transporter [Janibacter sp. YB324]SMC77159.1 putative hemolysin [Janibacter indicus]